MKRKSSFQSLCVQVEMLLKTTAENELPSSRENCICTIRAVYDAAQSFTRNSPPSAASETLHELIAVLLHVVVAEQLPFDASVLAASSIVSLLPHVHPGCADVHFRHHYLNVFRDYFDVVNSSLHAQTTDETTCSYCCVPELKSASIQSLLAFLHGFLKASPDWMYKKQSAINIFDIIPLLVSLVGSVGATWLYQLFIILELWCTKVRENLPALLNSCKDEKTTCEAELLLSVCSLEQNRPGSLFKVLSTHWESPVKGVPGLCISILSNMISIFDGITSAPPPETSLSDLLQGASLSPPAHSSPGTSIVLGNVQSSGLWSSRATYATLQSLLLGHHLTAQQLVERCGRELCEGMCGGLRSSHLATCVTALYRLVLPALTQKLWLLHFLQGFVAALTSDNKTIQHNLMTLWLPVTIQRHPSVWQQLLAACPDSNSGWRAKLAVLRSAQSALSPHILCLGAQTCVVASERTTSSENQCFDGHAPAPVDCSSHKTTTENLIVNNEFEVTLEDSSELITEKKVNGMIDSFNDGGSPGLSPSLVLCPAAVWLQALDHPVPAVRADALALLCTPPKCFSITEQQAKLIQEFFIYNINIDCSIFRLSVVKSFKHLMARLRDAICKWTKPFKRELEEGKKISCDKLHSELMVCSKLVVWFVRFLHHELASNGNYQRRILSLQLYKEVILSFSDRACKRKSNAESSALNCATNFINLHSAESDWSVQDDMFLASDLVNPSLCCCCTTNSFRDVLPNSSCKCSRRNLEQCSFPIYDFTLSHTIPLIISYLKHEMNDVRDESEELLSLLSEKAWLLYVDNSYVFITNASQNISSSRDLVDHPINLLQAQNVPNKKNIQSSIRPDITESSLETPASEAAKSVPAESHRTSVVFAQLLRDAVALLDCPKMSLAESGALTVRVVVAALRRLQCARRASLHQMLLPLPVSSATLTNLKDSDDTSLVLLRALLAKAEHDLAQARLNLLCAASSAPIYGTLLAVAAVLDRTSISTSSTRSAYEVFLPKVLLFCEDAVSFMLDNMALAAKEGAAVAPSFSEISESIERIIHQCKKTRQGAEEQSSSDHDDASNACSPDESDDEECGAISPNHQLVLSCCWQTIRAACVLCSTVLSSPLVRVCDAPADEGAAAPAASRASLPNSDCNGAARPTGSAQARGEESFVHLSTDVVKRAVDVVLIRTLTGTRHKGAIEAAKVCLGDTARVLLKRPATYSVLAELVDSTLIRELDLSDGDASTSGRRSVTRRAAGLAMLTQAVCVADYAVAGRGAQPALLLRTLDTLLLHASHDQQQESELGDCRSSVVLHLLQGAVQQLQHCPRLDDIAAACISAFTSTCWRCRNAGLQLFGGVVSRLVGQKKVAQDSSEYNSITAPQFIAAHLQLARSILQLLRSAARAAAREGSCRNPELDPTYLVESSRSPLQSGVGDQQESLLQLTDNLGPKSGAEEIMAEQNCLGKYRKLVVQNSEDRSEFKDASHNGAGFQAEHFGRSEVELSPAVLPVLCLLSRLSPGLQLSVDDFADLTLGFQECLLNLLASSIVNIRSLAAVSLLSLTPQAEQQSLMNRLLHRLGSETFSYVEKFSDNMQPSSAVVNDQFVATNEKHGLLLVVKGYIERSIRVTSSRNANAFQMAGALGTLYSNEKECYVIRALACECLLLLNDRESLSIDERSLFRGHIYSPGYTRFVELSLLYLLHAACSISKRRTILFYLTKGSYNDAETVGNFWIESILQMKDPSIHDDDREIAQILVHSVLSRDAVEKSGLFLKLVCSLLELNSGGQDLLAGLQCTVVCTDSLVSVLRGSLNASTRRNLLLLISHLRCLSYIKLADDVAQLFCENVVKFSGESYNEEFRLCSAKCVGLILPCLMADVDVSDLRYLKKQIVRVVCDLLCDEDPGVRDTVSSEVFRVLRSTQKHPLHPNKTLIILLQHFAQLCILKHDSVLLESLWTYFVECGNKYAGFKAKTKGGVKAYLFESDALNLYKENDVITQVLERTLLTIAQDSYCARLLLRLCSAPQISLDFSPPDLNASTFLLLERLRRFCSDILVNVEDSKVQT